MTCNQVASDPEDPTNYYNDANYCDPEYDKLYEQQKVELDPEKRLDIVHEMLERRQQSGVYNVALRRSPTRIAYRKDRFDGWIAAAGGDGAGALLEHLADVRAAEAGLGHARAG